MSRWWVAVAIASLCALFPTWQVGVAGAPPDHSISVEGADVGMFPAFDPSVARYAIATGAATNGTVEVVAHTSDPAGEVRVNGRAVPGESVTLQGLEVGDEIAVFIDDAAGHTAYSLIYLPAAFPTLSRVTPASSEVAAGHVFLTLGLFTQPSPFFETAVDDNGVPAHVFTTGSSLDFKPQLDGQYSVARSLGDARGSEIVVLDDQLREVDRRRAVGLVNTDGHDFLLRDDGSAYLMSYEPNPETGLTDAVIQHVSRDGEVLFQWNSADHVDAAAETVVAPSDPDYAHVNSFEVLPDGDLLVSFRHLSSIFRIARTAHDEYAQGDVIWKLGGRDSDFSFIDAAGDPDLGPCAQHTATRLANGNFMAFDNGAWAVEPLCVDPDDADGPAISRTPSRVVEWQVDPATHVATVVREIRIDDRYAIFAGSAQALDNGNALIGWASANQQAVATEVNAEDETVWELKATQSPSYFTYRAHRALFPDKIAPVVEAHLPSTLELGVAATPYVDCTDRGGSSLIECEYDEVDTSTPGVRSFAVTATDGAGNETTVTRPYTVSAPSPTETPTPTPTETASPTVTTAPTASAGPLVPAVQIAPDLSIRTSRSHRWLGNDRYDVRRGQVARTHTRGNRVVTTLRVQNDGSVADRVRVRLHAPRGVVGRPAWAAHARRSRLLEPGESWTFRLVVRRPSATADLSIVRMVARSVDASTIRDRVWLHADWR